MKKSLLLGLVLIPIILAGSVALGLVILHFPNTLKVHVVPPLQLIGPTPANVFVITNATGSFSNVTLTIRNNIGTTQTGNIYFTANATGGWNNAALAITGQAFTMTFNMSAPVGPSSQCPTPVPNCAFALTAIPGNVVIVAKIQVAPNVPPENFAIDFFLAQ